MASVVPGPNIEDIEQAKPNREEDSTDVHITSSKWLLLIYCNFPLFTNESIRAYDIHSSKSVNPIVFIPSFFVYFALMACRCGFLGFESSYFNGDVSHVVGLRLAAIVDYSICLTFFSLYCAVHFLRLTGRDHMSVILTARLKKWLPFRLEELMLFNGIVAWSLALIARVLKGQCLSDVTLWQQQTCNPFANNGGIPTELAYSLYAMVLLGQLIMKSVSILVLTVSYILCLAVVAFCVFYSKSNDYFVLINGLFFINASFEIMRLQRVNYVKMLKVKKHEKMALEQLKQEQGIQEVVRAQELMLHRVEDEKRLKESEAVQLRSLMGNVAHDLKTPLFAIEADVDTLKLHFSYLSEVAIHEATTRLRERTNKV